MILWDALASECSIGMNCAAVTVNNHDYSVRSQEAQAPLGIVSITLCNSVIIIRVCMGI